MLTKQNIVELLRTNDRAVARALVVLNERQTSNEQASEVTINRNGRGFRPCHARMGTSMAKFFLKRGSLSAKQVAYWRAKDRSGKMRVEIYAGQLLEAAAARAAAKAASVVAVKQELVAAARAEQSQVCNMEEARLVLLEQLAHAKSLEQRNAINREIDLLEKAIFAAHEAAQERRAFAATV